MIDFSIHFGGDPRHDIDEALSRRRFYGFVVAFVCFVLGFGLLAAVLFVQIFLAS